MDKTIHCVILRGAGKDFCAGYELNADPVDSVDKMKADYWRLWGEYDLDANPKKRRDVLRGGSSFDDDTWNLQQQQYDRMQLFDMHKPVIACIHGNCLAGGNDVAGLCDLIVCAEDATFAFPPARDLGCLPNQMWFYHLGPQWTKRLALTGDSVDGKTAAEIGLALKCVPAEDLEEEVEGIADRMCLIDPECVPHFRSRLVDCIG